MINIVAINPGILRCCASIVVFWTASMGLLEFFASKTKMKETPLQEEKGQ